MQEQSAQAPLQVSNFDVLAPFIIFDRVEEFERALGVPVGFELFIQCLEQALKSSAIQILHFLDKCKITPSNGSKKYNSLKTIFGNEAKQMLRHICVEYAEFFRVDLQLQQLRVSLINKVLQLEYKASIIAAISGDATFFEKLSSDIPALPSSAYYPLIVMAAANDQANIVRFFVEHKQNPHEIVFHRNAMVAAILCNANQVFDYLIKTDFNPNSQLSIDKKWPSKLPQAKTLLELAISQHRYNYSVQLVLKGAAITQDVMCLACIHGDREILDYCASQNIPFSSHSLHLAAKHGQTHLIRYLHDKGFCLDKFDDEKYTPLFHAVKNNKLDAVKELVALNANFTAKNQDGDSVTLIAIKYFRFEILQYLLDLLRENKTLEVNSALSIVVFSMSVIHCRADKKLITDAKKVVDVLIEYGAKIFDKCITYRTPDFFTRTNSVVHYLNYLAVNQLLAMGPPSLEYAEIAEILHQYYNVNSLKSKLSPDLEEFFQLYLPDVSKLSQYHWHLRGLKHYLSCEKHSDDTFKHMANMIARNPQNTINVLPAHIVNSIEKDFDAKRLNVTLILDTLLKLPVCQFTKQLYLAMANELYKLFFNQLNPQNPAHYFLLPYGVDFYKVAIDESSSIEHKAKAEQLVKMLESLKSQTPPHMGLPNEIITSIKNNLICCAIQYSNIELIDDFINSGVLALDFCTAINNKHPIELAIDKISLLHLIERACKLHPCDLDLLQRIEGVLAKTTYCSQAEIRSCHVTILAKIISLTSRAQLLQTLKYFNHLITISDLDSYTHLMQQATPELKDKIHLCLLLTRTPKSSIITFTNKIFKFIEYNQCKILLNWSYMFSYFGFSEQGHVRFVNKFGRFVMNDNSNNHALGSLQKIHYKRVLYAILKIRMELIKLLISDYAEIENEIRYIDTTNDNLLFISYHKISQRIDRVIHEQVTLQGLSFSNYFLDTIARECVIHLKRAQISTASNPRFNLNIADVRDPDTDKRLTNTEITSSTPPKRQAI